MQPDTDDETSLVRKQMHEYTGETSIHGLKYVGEKERTIFERCVILNNGELSSKTMSHRNFV